MWLIRDIYYNAYLFKNNVLYLWSGLSKMGLSNPHIALVKYLIIIIGMNNNNKKKSKYLSQHLILFKLFSWV
jgi:hypothetical protein